MPSIEDNILCWGKTYDWKNRGDEWSEAWGGTEYLWHGTIMPRILSFVPTDTILEIAPGYGRCTQYLRAFCKDFLIVDLNLNCIDFCKKRFSDSSHIHYYVNDGRSLEMIGNTSIDFIFSWDSMVHCEADILESYLTECARILKPDGWGFIHHSNIGYYRNLLTGKLKCENIHARGETMTAQLFSKYCKKNGLTCVRQEVVNWGGNILNDCFSLFTKKTAIEGSDIKYIENNEFHKEIERIRNIAGFYTMQ